MPTIVCPTCGKTIRFDGAIGLCPSCAAVISAPKQSSAPKPKVKSAQAPANRGRSKGPADLSQFETASDEQFEPAPSEGTNGQKDPLILYLSVGAGAVVLVFAAYALLQMVLNRPAAPVAVAPPPRPAVVQDQTPPPVDDTPPPLPTSAPVHVINAAPPPPKPAWMSLKPVAPTLAAKPITDLLVEQSIKNAVAFLKSQFKGGQLLNPDPGDAFTGTDALCVYALLHAGDSISDSDLGASNPFMQGLLDQLKKYDMSGGYATYGRALRASALAMNDRDVDGAQLGKDLKYLTDSEVSGAYQYSLPPKGSTIDSINWDHSNSQYGVLGIWAGVQAGILARDKYWNDVEQHWLKYQAANGSWGYKADADSLTMTCAGVTTLCVTAEQLELIASKGKHDAHPQMSQAINKAVDWIGKDNRILEFNPSWTGYSLYGVERMALATGYRWFGVHDWYRELGAREIKNQTSDGSWNSSQIETAFRVLFLSRGRQPILLNKLRFDGDWNDRPRDAAKFTQFASAQLEKPFAWGVADLSRNWWDWMESPYLFITTDAAPNFTNEDCQKLRAYTDAGGMIFFHNEYGSKEVDDFVNDFTRRAYPDLPLKIVAPDDVIYSTVFPMKPKPLLKSISTGTRTLLVYSPKDITEDWVRFKAKDNPKDRLGLQLGLNLFIATAGKSDFRNRLNSPYEEIPDFDAIGTLPVAQVEYAGPWNPEHKAYERFGRWFQKQTSIKLDVRPVDLLNLSATQTPIATMTGNAVVDFSKMDLHVLHDYVAQGGVLVIDSTGGSKAFAASVRQSLFPAAFPEANPTAIPSDHPILAGGSDCMDSIPKPRVRNFVSMQFDGPDAWPKIEYAKVGKGTIIISELDVTTGLLGSGTYAVYGYTPTYSQSLMKNVILWALGRYH